MSGITWDELNSSEQQMLKELYEKRVDGIWREYSDSKTRYLIGILQDYGLAVIESDKAFPSASGCSVYEASLPLPDSPRTASMMTPSELAAVEGIYPPTLTPSEHAIEWAKQRGVNIPVDVLTAGVRDLQLERDAALQRVRELEAALNTVHRLVKEWYRSGNSNIFARISIAVTRALKAEGE